MDTIANDRDSTLSPLVLLLKKMQGEWSLGFSPKLPPEQLDAIRSIKDERAGLLSLVKQMAGNDLPELVAHLAGELHLAIGIAGIEKRRGDTQFARAEKLEAQLKTVSHPDAKVDEPIDVTRRRLAHVNTKIVADWMKFVREQTDYTKQYGGDAWPTVADVLHSSLLSRMMVGEQPLPDTEYQAKKNAELYP